MDGVEKKGEFVRNEITGIKNLKILFTRFNINFKSFVP